MRGFIAFWGIGYDIFGSAVASVTPPFLCWLLPAQQQQQQQQSEKKKLECDLGEYDDMDTHTIGRALLELALSICPPIAIHASEGDFSVDDLRAIHRVAEEEGNSFRSAVAALIDAVHPDARSEDEDFTR